MILEGKTVLVTGVGGGLGRECAASALRDGANVVIAARTADTLATIAGELDPSGERVASQVTDITDADSCGALVDLAKERFVLSSRDTSPAVFDKVIELCSEAGFSPQIASISTVWSSVVLMVRAGEGVSLLPVNEQQYRTRDLSFCPLKAKNAFVEFVMAWSPRRDNTLIRSFRHLALMHKKAVAMDT